MLSYCLKVVGNMHLLRILTENRKNKFHCFNILVNQIASEQRLEHGTITKKKNGNRLTYSFFLRCTALSFNYLVKT